MEFRSFLLEVIGANSSCSFIPSPFEASARASFYGGDIVHTPFEQLVEMGADWF